MWEGYRGGGYAATAVWTSTAGAGLKAYIATASCSIILALEDVCDGDPRGYRKKLCSIHPWVISQNRIELNCKIDNHITRQPDILLIPYGIKRGSVRAVGAVYYSSTTTPSTALKAQFVLYRKPTLGQASRQVVSPCQCRASTIARSRTDDCHVHERGRRCLHRECVERTRRVSAHAAYKELKNGFAYSASPSSRLILERERNRVQQKRLAETFVHFLYSRICLAHVLRPSFRLEHLALLPAIVVHRVVISHDTCGS